MKTNELSGIALDWAVAKAGGTTNIDFVWELTKGKFNPSTDWARGGVIIERERIGVWFCDAAVDESGNALREMYWYAEDQSGDHVRVGETPLEAAMRCYVASKLGNEVEIPEGLYETT
jgi:hypothetical protein